MQFDKRNDWTCLAENCVYPASFEKTGINQNEIVVGDTGSGKSVSVGYARLLHTFNSSVIIPFSKKEVEKKFSKLFRDRGYEVVSLDFSHPEQSDYGYDPLDFIKSEDDIMTLSTFLVKGSGSKKSYEDPYWEQASSCAIFSLISLAFVMAETNGERPRFSKVCELSRKLALKAGNFGLCGTTLDEDIKKYCSGTSAYDRWQTITNLSPRTASCVISIVNGAIGKVFSDRICELTRKEKRIKFAEIGRRKTAVFINLPPFDTAVFSFVDLMYNDAFKTMFAEAEASPKGRLKVPVHFIFDDFAVSINIVDFDKKISVFRAAGISCTLLLQSEAQLVQMYGEKAAQTILSNAATHVFMGCMDLRTCKSISERLNKPLSYVLSMPLGDVIVFRRGNAPVRAKRYQTFNDPEYLKMIAPKKKKQPPNLNHNTMEDEINEQF